MERDTEQWTPREVARLLALVEKERRYYQDIVGSMPSGLLIVSSGLTVLSSNRPARKLFRLRSADLTEVPLEKILPPDLVEKARETLQDGVSHDNIVIPAPGDPQLQIRIHMRPIPTWDDEPGREALIGVEDFPTGTPADSTDPADGFPANDLLDSLPAVFWAAALPTHQFLYVSENADTLLGYPASHWLETPSFWEDRIYPDDLPWVRESYERSASRGIRNVCEFRARRPDGRLMWVRESSQILEDAEGRGRHLIGFSIDITQRRMLETQTVQAQRIEAAQRTSLALSAEVNNQIAVIAGYSEQILAKLGLGHPLQPELTGILDATDRLRAIAAKPSPVNGRIAPEAIEICNVIEGLEPDLHKELGSEIPLELKLFRAPMGVLVPHDVITEALLTLARRARRERSASFLINCAPAEIEEDMGPRATLRQGVYATIDIEDTGRNLEPDARAAIFEPFADAGLAAMYTSIRRWGGDIAVSRNAPQGVVFRILLPRAGEPARTETPYPEDVPTPAKPAKKVAAAQSILVLEPEAGIRSLICKVLTRQNYDVLESADLDDAILKCEQNPGGISLVIADITTPEVLKPASLERMRKTSEGVRVLYLAGFADGEQTTPIDLSPGTSALQKPFTLGALVQKVAEMLAVT